MNSQSGFIAIMSSIIIVLVVTTMAFALGMLGFFNRFNILDSQLKETSFALAEACGDTALLNLANNPNYTPVNEVVSFGSEQCTIVSLQSDTPAINQTTIKTKAVENTSVSNIQIVVNSDDLSVITWQEIPTL